MNENFIDKIKSRGYWRINFRPLGLPNNLSNNNLKTLVRENNVQLRGWYYPFFRDGSDSHYGLEVHNDNIRAWIDWEEYKEFWHLYKSGQFLHYNAVHEDWYSNDRVIAVDMKPGKYLNFIGSLTYYLTEVIEFLTRLNRTGIYPDGVKLSIELHNTKGRQLESFEAMRSLFFPKVTNANIVRFEKNYSSEDLKAQAADLAIEPIRHFFDAFNFGDISDDVIKHDQENLYGYKGGSRG